MSRMSFWEKIAAFLLFLLKCDRLNERVLSIAKGLQRTCDALPRAQSHVRLQPFQRTPGLWSCTEQKIRKLGLRWQALLVCDCIAQHDEWPFRALWISVTSIASKSVPRCNLFSDLFEK